MRDLKPRPLTALLAAAVPAVLAVLSTAPAAYVHAAGPVPVDAPKGHLVLIGGGEKPLVAMKKFVELAGGPSAPIVVVPTASEDPDVAPYYTKLFREEHGVKDVVVLPIKTREDAGNADLAAAAARAKGIFFAGGDQVRITKALLDTPVGKAIEAAFRGGAVVGGTSAGTACQSALMITGEGDFKAIRANVVELTRGLGFFRGVVVDQHFVARQRLNRLLSVVLEHPDLVGVGIDEDTAAWVKPDGTFEVLGDRSVVVVDAKGAAPTRKAVDKGSALLGVRDLKIHILLPGDGYDPFKRSVIPGPATAQVKP
jgi:cyanophycinase